MRTTRAKDATVRMEVETVAIIRLQYAVNKVRFEQINTLVPKRAVLHYGCLNFDDSGKRDTRISIQRTYAGSR